MDISKVTAKLAAARTKLILDKPFLGALVLRLPLTAANANWCPTTATDAKAFYYNPAYIDGLSDSQTQFVLSHEALHCALSHFARRSHRIKHRWDLACDFAINPLLIEDGLEPPAEALVLAEYNGMTAEEIYPLIGDTEQMQTHDRHVYDATSDQGQPTPSPGHGEAARKKPDQPNLSNESPEDSSPDGGASSEANSEPPGGKSGTGADANEHVDGHPRHDEELADAPQPLSRPEQETLQVQWQQRLAGAAQQALQAGMLGGNLARLIDHLLQPQLPWRMLLARYMTAVARDDFSYVRPSRREGDAIFPSLRSSQIELAIAIDTSGSIKTEEIAEFVAEVAAIKGQLRARISLLPCDSHLAADAPLIYEPWEELPRLDRIQGGGGTDFRPVFDWLATHSVTPDLLVYFTDAAGTFPAGEPNFPVIWLVKGRGIVPWGQRIQLN